MFELNPRDSVLATTNPIPVNDLRSNTTTGLMNAGVIVSVEGITNSGRDIGGFFQEPRYRN